ncbi:hypothetical protein [Clostridium sp.]|jgi:hypothetical protein|uniref:hypothetical protein n=1 Tax=Clostridium sp. TaxID=1506 RepID=UPI002FDE8E57
MNKYIEKQSNKLNCYYNGREVIIIKYLRLIDTVIISFKDDKQELRSVKRACLETTDIDYKSTNFIRVDQLSKLY